MLQTLNFPCNPPTLVNFRFRCRAAVQSVAPPARKAASLYEVLRVNRDASTVEIKAAYRSLAKQYHPDAASSQSDGRDFIQIHNAYETLSDPSARALYDLSLGLGLGLGIDDRETRFSSSSFGCYSVGRRPTRRWETDQCW